MSSVCIIGYCVCRSMVIYFVMYLVNVWRLLGIYFFASIDEILSQVIFFLDLFLDLFLDFFQSISRAHSISVINFNDMAF